MLLCPLAVGGAGGLADLGSGPVKDKTDVDVRMALPDTEVLGAV